MAEKRRPSVRQRITSKLLVLALLVAVMWALLLVHLFAPDYSLNHLTLRSGTRAGLLGIPLAPFLHVDQWHLFNNTLPFLVLGGLVLMRSWGEFYLVSLIAMALSGAGAWYFGELREPHLGSSGLIFGYFGFLLARGLFERTLLSLTIAAAVGFLYGGLIWGIFPSRPELSWQAHLFGFLAGVVCGHLLARKRR